MGSGVLGERRDISSSDVMGVTKGKVFWFKIQQTPFRENETGEMIEGLSKQLCPKNLKYVVQQYLLEVYMTITKGIW